MSDIIERLRSNTFLAATHPHFAGIAQDCSDGAAEIESLRARLADKEILLAEAVEYGTGYKQAYDEAMANYQMALARLAEAERDAALGRIAMRFVDRAGDVCDEDTARTICAEFHNAMANAVERLREARGLPAARLTDSAAVEGEK